MNEWVIDEIRIIRFFKDLSTGCFKVNVCLLKIAQLEQV